MRARRFRTLRLWLNTTVWGTFSVFLLLMSVIFALITDRPMFMVACGSVVVVGLVVAFYRDRSVRCAYLVEDDRVVMRNGRIERIVSMGGIRDVSLLDGAAAREYFAQRARTALDSGLPPGERRSMAVEFMRFCPLDIGMGGLSLRLGARLMDRGKKHDLVLLRLSDGTDHLLAPLHAQDMVAVIDRVRSTARRA